MLGLSPRLAEGVRRKGYRLVSPDGPGERSGITAFRHPGLPSTAIAARLEQAGVDITECNGNLRARSHFYNTDGDIDWLLAELP
ncbi:hypothetical protein [Poseidonocella sp. HB161398]|uniref:hypothetical protein n=1 Tax=Poseidonocella sp. HB161398 TaxID=2320855 RepID=UPI001F0FC9A8|nr:hypothetical protein [Poseidonocella sp. HB161398]